MGTRFSPLMLGLSSPHSVLKPVAAPSVSWLLGRSIQLGSFLESGFRASNLGLVTGRGGFCSTDVPEAHPRSSAVDPAVLGGGDVPHTRIVTYLGDVTLHPLLTHTKRMHF